MANTYGLDFLKTEHRLDEDQPGYGTNYDYDDQNHSNENDHGNLSKSDLEKQFEIIHFLLKHRSSGFLPPSIIYQKTGIDLSGASDVDKGDGESFIQKLLRNPKICTEEVPDPENPSIKMLTFGYQSKFSEVHDKTTLLALINRCKNGVSYNDLKDAYIGVEVDLDALITAGDILALENDTSGKDKTLFPRGEPFLVELDGHISPNSNINSNVTVEQFSQKNTNFGFPTPGFPNNTTQQQQQQQQNNNNNNNNNNLFHNANSMLNDKKKTNDTYIPGSIKTQVVQITRNPKSQIRRGEAIWIGGQWHRVSSSTKQGVPLSEQPPRARAPPSVVLQKDLSKKNDQDGYVFPLTTKLMSGDRILSDEAIQNLRAAAAARERLSQAFTFLRSCGAANTLSARSLMNGHGGTTSDLAGVNTTSNSSKHGNGGGAGGSSILRKRPSSRNHRFGAHSNHHMNHIDSNRTKCSNGGNHKNNKKGLSEAQIKASAIEAARTAKEDPALAYSFARRHGCTKDVRAMYFETKKDIPQSEAELYKDMIKAKLIEEWEAIRRAPVKKKKSNVDNDGKPKKMRYYVNKKHRITNTHLDNTELGRKLERAMERQAQGKDVGDGGM